MCCSFIHVNFYLTKIYSNIDIYMVVFRIVITNLTADRFDPVMSMFSEQQNPV